VGVDRSLVRPGPNPPPIGEPPILSTARIVLDAAQICHDATKTLEAGF